MTQKTNTDNKQTANISENSKEAVTTTSNMSQDLKNSVLIVSVVLNLFILTAWIALQVTPRFDAQLSSFLFKG
jgi:hypothetical protein